MSNPRVAAIQMCSGPEVKHNLQVAGELIQRAAEGGAELVILPEFFAMMGRDNAAAPAIAEPDGQGPIQQFLADISRDNRIWVVGGTFPMASDSGKFRAACCVYDDRGRRMARYDKIHLFDVDVAGDSLRTYRESRNVEAGNDVVLVDTPIGRLGLAVCYDLRFPELFRNLLCQGMQILSLPSAFTAQTGEAHWDVLVRARAIENLCYVVAPAQFGSHASGRQTFGHSMVVDPWGNVVDRLDSGAGVVSATIDLGRLTELRQEFPAIEHIRMDFQNS